MKSGVSLFFCLMIVLFSSCVSDSSMSAGKKTAILMAAEDYSVGIEKTIDSKTGKQSLLFLKLINIKGDFAPLPLVQSSSFAALNFYSDLNAKDCEGVNGIKIILETDSGSREKEYSFNELNHAKKDFKIIENFFRTFNSSENKFSFFDTAYTSGEEISDISDKASELGLSDAKGISFTGFEFTHLETDNKAIVVIWGHKRKSNVLFRYTFHLLQETDKIVYINVTGRK